MTRIAGDIIISAPVHEVFGLVADERSDGWRREPVRAVVRAARSQAEPLAAILGIPIYLTSEASLPMVAALMDGGLGAGPAMAFLITGAGTSLGAITGMLLIARRRVVGLVVAILLAGGFLVGWAAALAL